MSKKTVAFAHLGCEKNRVDTEHMLGLLAQAGYGVSADEADATVVVVNTCSFIQDAREESVRTLVELAEQGKELIIAGCLAQHFQEELLESLPEAKAIVGTGDYQHIVSVLERVEAGERVKQVSANPTFVGDEHLPRYRTTSEAIAYLKVAEGCDYRCAFCIIPHLRGDQRSRTIESIVAEAQQLAAQGVQELVLISQITTNYGLDLAGKPQLAELLRALGEVEIPWIRVHYAYPTGLTEAVLAAYREVPNVLPYLDLPLQHSHPEVLRAMNRPWQADVTSGVLRRIREQLPDAVLRTTFIVGFPGELPDQVPAEVAQERKDRLMALQQPIAAERNAAWVGRIVDVLIEQENPSTGEMIGRCARFAPEVDGEVRVMPGEGGLCAAPGTMVPVRITAADTYDLIGEVVGAQAMVRDALAARRTDA